MAVSGDEWLHEVPIEIFQRFPWSVTDTGIPFLQIRTDKSKPHVARYSHIRPQSRGGTARVIGEKLLNFLFQIQGKLFDRKGNHIEESFLTLGVVSIKPHDGTTLPRARAVPLNIGHQKRVTPLRR